jgi:leucyl aminopeptidase
MRIKVSGSVPRAAGGRRVALLHERRDPAAGVPRALRATIATVARASGFGGRDGEVAAAASSGGDWVLYGLGKAPAKMATYRNVLRRAARDAAQQGRKRLVFVFDDGISVPAFRALLPQIALADYAFDRYKTREREKPAEAQAVAVPPPATGARNFATAAREGERIAAAVRWVRDAGNTPANDLGPAEFAREAKTLAARSGFRLRVLDRGEIEKEKMGGLLGVAAGSARPPVFLIAEYTPRRTRGTAVLVGKGITFDSGGISLKPAASMGEMKYDMMGAATALGCVAAAQSLALPVRVVALAPVTENMPGGKATRPGDILRMRNGKTVEVDNTDAEGRLVLGDALSYAEKFRPDVLLDYATLTGAVLIALGHECAGLMTPDDLLAAQLEASGDATGERVWRLPVWDDYRENLKSEWADMKNVGGRAAGTINAGVFLKEFVPQGTPWAHLDVAGVAHFEKAQGGWPAGASGFGVALTMDFLRRRFP